MSPGLKFTNDVAENLLMHLFVVFTVVVNFPVIGEPDVLLVAWTTTPWTLPSNLALCVNPELDYVKVQGKVKSFYFFHLIFPLSLSLPPSLFHTLILDPVNEL